MTTCVHGCEQGSGSGWIRGTLLIAMWSLGSGVSSYLLVSRLLDGLTKRRFPQWAGHKHPPLPQEGP